MQWLRKMKARLVAAQTEARERRIAIKGTVDDKLTLVSVAPLRWAQAPGRHPFVWPRHTTNGLYLPSDIYITIGGMQVAYIQRVVIDPTRNRAVIGHFAVESGFEKRGLGRAVAMAFREAVAHEYGVRTIIFSEDSPHYDTAGYPSFFTALGAKEIAPRWPYVRPDWEW